MRIRKNANLSTILEFSAPEWRLQTHVCHMNQSPWDVISFSDETYPAALNQFGGGDDSFAVNTSFGDSAGVVESLESMMDEDDKAMEMETEDDNGGRKDEERTKIKKKKFCSKTSVSSSKRGGGAVVDRGSRPGRAKKGSSLNSSNPYEFYYYSGFGPLWGKRRAGKNGGGGEAKIKRKSSKSKEMEGVVIQNTILPPSPSLIDHSEELDFVEEEDDYEEDNEEEQRSSNGGKKRVRKLVKARSLKSLM
ncbi:hypothetical protein HS088_TW18G00433 [Tripterygium wilfordii]|uniref:Uncharacterized protein n=1 Tax=Tripterygium wilfordii TaxID=458696 RepID=A0A7J7CC72_TRIWF|nr:uncharacterized protein LOC119983377 [Tripterygium wilfordii]KAF5731748.1 hypothetical protein HS088_TW18G00433 [Tripterygium wilfordii]